MATGPQQKRKELREKRLQAEAAAKGADKRQNLFKIVGIAVFAVVVAIVAVVLISSSGSDNGGGGENAQAQLDGIVQTGSTLGDPDAAVTLVEFGDLQCPVCKQYATDILPDVITGPVKNGTANFDFQNWAILGPDSALAAKAALAAGEQNRMWNFIEAFYSNQGVENTGYVTDEFLTDIAEDAGIPDIDKWNEDREKPARDEELAEIDETASGEGFSGTPSFAIRTADGTLTPINDTQSSEAIIKAINDAADTGPNQQNGN